MARPIAFAATAAAVAALAISASPAQAASLSHPNLNLARTITTDYSKLEASYDYIVVGGGLAGLTVAARLSEDPDVTVAVIEAGDSGIGESKLTTPNANLYDSSLKTPYDWQWTTTSQNGLNGRSADWPRGKVLGGSSAVNGLYMVRSSKIESDLWAGYTGAEDRFSWDTGLFPAMKKSESFSPPTAALLKSVPSTQFNLDSHGTNGPIHATWPATSYPVVEAYLQTLNNLGVPINSDPDSGNSWGTFYATSAINPTNWTRSFSRTGYLDPNRGRSNLDILTGHQVTKVIFDSSSKSSDGLLATGVQYAQYDGDTVRTIKASREVILSGGAVNSPQILQLSGIGSASLLSQYKIKVLKDLPGVGFHVQDHLATAVNFSPKTDNLAPASVTGDAKKDSYVNAAISYVNVTTLFGGQAGADFFLNQLRANISKMVDAYDAPSQVKAGYRRTLSDQIETIFNSPLGLVELLFAMGFGQVSVQGALQHPLSRGSIQIVSANPFTAPTIDPGYLSVEADAIILRQGLKLARQVGNGAPLSTYFGDETKPGSGTQSDAAWEEYIRESGQTEYHPSCSCSQLPEDMGGVVDRNLLVYGTSNLRVIDSSIPPISVSAHLMTATYGIGEIGAQIVKDARAVANGTAQNSATGSGPSGNGTSSGSSTGGKNTAARMASGSMLLSLALPVAVGAVLAMTVSV
ncbi:unnamed protein product [Tilletia controversa]|uniref:Glucose-methanol-choline oxidoreductase N-terminal domain-containing protein n=1 Tax=Tilletia controversa TaxID=13291 RepID=A0A8X7MWB5_9BASI|nr:hypothetical protein CF328_g7776 [Tilletia controversa]KAE8251931.1 hypothetical protein A4X06_0g2478 [Tilletia controversa]CAD6962296.1 unnamed protein product [Tilletia controversa]CAD6983536.1 unnamed protein product [Tilletia controversa]